MIGLIFAASVAAGTYTYKTSYHGADLGTSKITVTNAGNTTQISEQTSGAYSGTAGTASATLVLDGDLSPTSYRATGNMGGNPISDSATLTADTAQVTNAQGATSSIRLDNGAKHFVVVDLGTLAGFLPLPAQMKAWNDPSVLAVIPSFGQSLPYAPQAAANQSRPAGVPAADVALVFAGHTPFTVWYDPTSLVPDEIDVPSQTLAIVRVP
jgi:hypothetical protein